MHVSTVCWVHYGCTVPMLPCLLVPIWVFVAARFSFVHAGVYLCACICEWVGVCACIFE